MVCHTTTVINNNIITSLTSISQSNDYIGAVYKQPEIGYYNIILKWEDV